MASRKRSTIPAPTMTVVPEKWTWQMAEAALAKNKANRHLRETEVAKYARLMENDLWGAAEALPGFRAAPGLLIFDWDGNLADGQHRLMAQVKSKTTQWHYVLRDVPPTTQQFVDAQIPRSAADLLKWNGFAEYSTLQGVARWAFLLENGWANTGRIRVSKDEILDMCIRHPDLEHSCSAGVTASRSQFFQKILGPTPLGAAHWWIAQHNDHAEADIFFDRISNLNRESDGSAVLALQSRLYSASLKGEKIQLRTRIAMIVRAWNLDVARTYVHNLPSRSRSGEYPVPTPEKRLISQEHGFGPADETPDQAGEEPTEE